MAGNEIMKKSSQEETTRLAALRAYEILDTSEEEVFDDITRLASFICNTPISLISLVDEHRQWFKSRLGLQNTETAREVAFCSHAIEQTGVMIVPDAREDSRFAANPLVTSDPDIRFYAGAPLITPDGSAIGTLCVIDRVPRQLSGQQLESLQALSRRVISELELRKNVLELKRTMSDQEKTEQALRESRARSESIISNMINGLITVDEQTIIESVNPAAVRIFGYQNDELVGQTLALLVPGDIENKGEFLRLAFKKAIGRLTEWEGRRKNGETFPFEMSLFAFETGGRRHFAGNIRDLTEKRQIETMKRDFVSTVSHELRTPLTSIRGSLGLLAGGVFGPLPDEATEAVSLAERNTIRLISLINDILDFEKIESGTVELRFEPLPMHTLVERSIDAVRAVIQEKRITIDTTVCDREVLADSDRTVQVLVNLLSNAIKFSGEDSKITIECIDSPGWVETRVSDRGRGIPQSHRTLIFERFQQVDSADSRKKGGTGLGLAISKAIIEQHGGTIGVESELGKGSTFWFRLPMARPRSVVRRDVVLCCAGSTDSLPPLVSTLGSGTRLVTSPSELLTAMNSEETRFVVIDVDHVGRDQTIGILGRISERRSGRPHVLLTGREAPAVLEAVGNLSAILMATVEDESFLEAIQSASAKARDVLIIEDDVQLLEIMERQFRQWGASVRTATGTSDALRLTREKKPGLIVLDVILSDGSGFEVVDRLRGDSVLSSVPLLVHTAHELTEDERARLKLGPTRFLMKSKSTADELHKVMNSMLDKGKPE